MKLGIVIEPGDLWTLQRYSRGDGGFQTLAKALLAAMRIGSDGSGRAELKTWAHIAQFVRQRDTECDGGFQNLLRRFHVTLERENGTTLTSWSWIRAAIVKNEHTATQIELWATHATTCGEQVRRLC